MPNGILDNPDCNPVITLINSTSVLSWHEGRWCAANSPMSIPDSSLSCSMDELCSLHPYIKDSIPYWMKRSSSHLSGVIAVENEMFYTATIKSSLSLWHNPCFITNDAGERIYYHQLTDLEWGDDGEPIFTMNAYDYEEVKGASGNLFGLAYGCPLKTHSVTAEWLNSTFPNWQEKSKAAESLGYEGEELVRVVFTQEAQTNTQVQLQEVTWQTD